jgi:arylsulfatase A-like enzyme
VLLLDDVGVDKVAAYGEHPDAGPTPVLDTLARHGALFRNAWATPVCSPARATLLTGRQPFRHGVGETIGAGDPPLADAEVALPEALAPAGYRTAALGKWHLAPPDVDDPWGHPITWGGFERHIGTRQNIGDYFEWVRGDTDASGSVQQVVTTYATTQIVDDALDVIEGFGGQPWLLWVAFHAPHKPLHVPPAALHTQGTPDDPVEQYRAMLEAVDSEIGRLLASLRPAVLQRTYVFVLGDNGTYAAAITPPFGLGGGHKGTVREEGVNVPFVVVGPDVEPGERPALVHIADLFPTVLELAGLPLPPVELDGLSLVRVLRSRTRASPHEHVFTQRFQPNGVGLPRTLHLRAARDRRYKLIYEKVPGQPLFRALFDLADDPFELSNLLAAPALGPGQQQAYDELAAYMASQQ